MNTLRCRAAVVVLLLLVMGFGSGEAAVPKDGRYKGTMIIRTQVDGNVKAEVKKVFPVAGVLASGKLLVVTTEIPDNLGSYFTSTIFTCTVSDGAVSLLPNNNALSFSLSDVKTLTSSIKGTADFGVYSPPTGSGAGRILLDFAVTRAGN